MANLEEIKLDLDKKRESLSREYRDLEIPKQQASNRQNEIAKEILRLDGKEELLKQLLSGEFDKT